MNYEEYELPHIDGLPLTAYGAGKLAVFEPADLSYAAEHVLKRGHPVTSATYGKFYNIAKEHCLKSGRKENWVRMFKVLKAQGYDGFKEDEPILIGTAQAQPAKAFREPSQSNFGRFMTCHTVCSGLLRDRSTCVFIKMVQREQEAAEWKASGALSAPARKRDYNWQPVSVAAALQQYVDTAHKPATIKGESFADGQPIYQTEEELDDIYYTGGSDGLSQTSYIP